MPSNVAATEKIRSVHAHVFQYAAHFAGYDEFGDTPGSEPTTLGSGTFVELPDRRLTMATCAHIIRDTPHADPTEWFQFLLPDQPHRTGWRALSMMKWGGDLSPIWWTPTIA
jgi:hypothetical protein